MCQICRDQLGQHNQTDSKNQKYWIYSKEYYDLCYEVSKMLKLKLEVEEIWKNRNIKAKKKTIVKQAQLRHITSNVFRSILENLMLH